MAKTCGNCVYAKICKKAVGSWFSPKNIAYCEAYKDSTNFVEVVRCKDCRHLEITGCYGECNRGYMGIVKPWDFCSYGEKRENDTF